MPCSIPYAPHLTTVPAPDHILLPNSQTPLAVGALPDPRSKCLEGIACPELPRADKLTRGAPGAPHEREVVWSRAREDRVRTVPFYTHAHALAHALTHTHVHVHVHVRMCMCMCM